MQPPNDPHPQFLVNIEGTTHPWPTQTITTEQVAHLGGWDASTGVLEVDERTGEERTLAPGEVVELKPGKGFAKKVLFKRGDTSPRLLVEIAMVRAVYRTVEVDATGTWLRVPDYAFTEGWSMTSGPVVIRTPEGYPGAPPYGFWVPAGLRHRGQMPGNYTEPAAQVPPFDGDWGFFSWSPETTWCPTVEPAKGPNLLNWLLGLRRRFAEGA